MRNTSKALGRVERKKPMSLCDRSQLTLSRQVGMRVICLLACAMVCCLISLAQDKQSKDSRGYESMARKAYQEKDSPRYNSREAASFLAKGSVKQTQFTSFAFGRLY
jgi:hypothetical protein